ncbi:MAG TPA: trypsin-like peptidase domain-containing protein [Lapillicoccus sp.]|nr:trypsin-like peptidase domain-containing protein [Lapillicoccus sp.]
MTSVIEQSPPQFTAPETRAVLAALFTIYRREEIEKVVVDAGLKPWSIAFQDRADLSWRNILTYAAGQERVPQLLDAVVAERPDLGVVLAELRTGSPVVAADRPVTETAPTWKNFSADGRKEAVIIAGQPTFVDVAFLALGAERAKSVCRLTVTFPRGGGYGTGFRVGPRHLLTNHHVLFDTDDGNAKATQAEAWFDYETDGTGKLRPIVQIGCDLDTVAFDEANDWALVQTSKPIPDAYPALSMEGARQPKVDDRVYIVQHPEGQPKKIAFQHNLVRAVEPQLLQYWTDTEVGSSGSPVFDDQWNLVGLHHFAVPSPQGESTAMRNQGRLMSHVVQRMRDLNVFPGG